MRTTVEDQQGGRSRREILRTGARTAVAVAVGAGLGAGLDACDLGSDRSQPPPSTDPLAPLLAGALELVGRYDAALAAHPELGARLSPVRAAHLAHATALARLIGAPDPTVSGSPTSPGASPSPVVSTSPSGGPGETGDVAGTLAALRAAEQAGRRSAADACLAAPAARAVLLGSITAARATHLEVVR